MPLSRNDLDWFAARLSIAVYDTKQEYRMGRQTELRDKFNAPDLTVRFMGHFQIINLEGHEITIGSMATDEQIAAEIAKIRQITEKPTMSITGYEPGVIQAKLAEIKQKAAERRKQSLGKLDAAFANTAKVDDMIEAQAAQIDKETNDALQEFALTSNGGPA